MPVRVTMPVLGLTTQEGTVARWYKQVGDSVVKDEPLADVELDKGTVEVPSPADGVLRRIVVPEGRTVPVRALIAELALPGEPLADEGVESAAEAVSMHDLGAVRRPASVGAPAAAAVAVQLSPSVASKRQPVSPRARRVARELGVDTTKLVGSGPHGRVVERDVRAFAVGTPAAAQDERRILVTPLARRLAIEHGITLSTVRGTGPGGRITNEDVLAAAETRLGAPAPAGAPVDGAAGVQPLSPLRRVAAFRVAESARTAPHVTLTLEADLTELARLREQLQPELARSGVPKLPWDALLAKAAGLALREHQALNAEWVESQGIRLHAHVHVGVAVALEPEGLVVPVLRDADTRPLRDLAADMLKLADQARAGQLKPAAMEGGTFSITNLGAYRIDAFTPILNPPQAGILGVGRVADKAVVVAGQVAVRSMCTLSLTFDHRVVDGAPAAAFLVRLAEFLERPYMLLGV